MRFLGEIQSLLCFFCPYLICKVFIKNRTGRSIINRCIQMVSVGVKISAVDCAVTARTKQNDVVIFICSTFWFWNYVMKFQKIIITANCTFIVPNLFNLPFGCFWYQVILSFQRYLQKVIGKLMEVVPEFLLFFLLVSFFQNSCCKLLLIIVESKKLSNDKSWTLLGHWGCFLEKLDIVFSVQVVQMLSFINRN